MDIKQIKRIATVARLGSFSAAAKEHSVTVQAVSKSVTDLERQLGARLFLRRGHGVDLTAFGQLFVSESEKVLECFAELEGFVGDYAAGRIAPGGLSLMVSISNSRIADDVCERISTFVLEEMGVNATVQNGSYGACVKELSRGDIDGFITLGSADAPSTRSVLIGSAEPAFILAKNHPLAHRRVIGLSEARRYPISLFKVFDCSHEKLLEKYAGCLRSSSPKEGGSSTPNPRKFSRDWGLMMTVGVADAENRFSTGLCMRPLAGNDVADVPVCLVTRDEEACGALAFFLEQTRAVPAVREFFGAL